ncbi:TM2 domain-containing protein [Rhodococcoides corynebacterioides]|uniref:TM2 domain-containing protein n=1 Tax=Rhodococcoides corynebacterioides TaxID=53972 RepID=UPI0008359EAA|nr:TM2 domain-containing protein [Rhodococcus corynebacterioides]
MTEPYDRYRPDETQDTQHYRPNLQKGAGDASSGSRSGDGPGGEAGAYPSYPPLPEYGASSPEYQQPGYQQQGYQQQPLPTNPYAPNPYGAPPFGGWVDPSAPYGRHQQTGEPYGEKSKVVAGLLQLVPLVFALPIGIGRFYMGTNAIAIAQLSVFVVGVLLCLTIIGIVFGLPLLVVGWLWCLVDGIVVLAGTPRDGDGRLLRP